MNSFLGNLIDRHQEFNGHREIGNIVQPRPKATFETESDTTTVPANDQSSDYGIVQRPESDSENWPLLTQRNTDAVETLDTDETSVSRKQSPLEIQESFENKSTNSIDNHRFDDVNERIKALSVKLLQKSSVNVEERITPGEHNVQGAEALPDMNIRPENLSEDQFSLESESDNRIQKVLQHLQTQSTGTTPLDGGIHSENHILKQLDSQKIVNQTEGSGREEIIGPAQSRIQPEMEPKEPGRSTKSITQNGNGRSDNRVLQQPGLLQIPIWLTQMQADINNRRQEIYNKTETKNVVNVTIGRVEVRATQAQIPKNMKETAKPSGVMDLDEYLKQRERRSQI